MALLPRRAKSGNDWHYLDLEAYNITVEYQDSVTFFETPVLPQPTIHPEFLTAPDADAATNDDVHELLFLMQLATFPSPCKTSAVADFATLLLRTLGYITKGRHFRTHHDIYMLCGGEEKNVTASASIITAADDILLVVQEDKAYMEHDNAQGAVIAGAIAAFANNNKRRYSSQVPGKVMVGITFQGTMPTFYKVPVTDELRTSVMCGLYPDAPTIVYAFAPLREFPRPFGGWLGAMRPLDNRQIILSYFEAFKKFVHR